MIRKLEVVVTPSRSFPAAVTESTSTNQLPTSVVNPSHLETHPPIPRGYSTLHTATEPALDMLGTSITRVARSGYTPSSARAHLTAASYPFPWCSLSDHQRRHSSSKASIPPNGASRGRAAAAPAQQTSTSSTGRVSRRKTKVAVIESRFARLPSVPSTEHLNEADVSVSAFFSLGYRPISVTTAYPPASTPASFASIFETPMASRKHPPSDVIQTLGSTIETLAPGSSQSDSLRGEWQVLHEGHNPHPKGTHSRASIPRDIPFSKFTSNLRPFSPPPVPEALPVFMNETKARRPSKRPSKPKAWSTTIIVTEITTLSGEKILSAVNTPFKRLPTPKKRLTAVAKEPGTSLQLPVQQLFLHRVRIRNIRQMVMQEASRGKMLAISVKRQRKLKMKKHKYKKLMRRTRNQRRRLGRL